jgi:hypothetical protein
MAGPANAAMILLAAASAFGQAPSRISGRLLDLKGDPAREKTLHVFILSTNDPDELVSGADGRFVFSAPGGAAYTVKMVASRDPLQYAEIAKGIVAPGRRLELGDLGRPVSATPMLVSPAGRPGTIAAALFAGGVMRVLHAGGNEVAIPLDPAKDQVDVDSLRLSDDGAAIGWQVMSTFCCTSYPIALELVVHRPGKPVRRFAGDGRAIFEWAFFAGGRQVGYYQGFLHGVPAQHYELRDVATGRLLGQWNGEITARTPAWVLRLQH